MRSRGLKNYNDEMNYYSRTCDVIYDYYDLTNGMLYGKDFDQNLAEIQELEQKQEQKQKHEHEHENARTKKVISVLMQLKNDLLSKSNQKS